ncbi:MAG: FtsW/RodA/SpoVE family cell cycle protein [Phycisphaerae bacterium]|nr:FtsW/RodA/SpoVE family cell cycle protein [Phycisphaerae bacterium]
MKRFYNIIWQGRLSALRLIMLFMVAALLGVGLSCFGSMRDAGGVDYFHKQVQWVFIGGFVFVCMNAINYRKLGKYTDLIFMVTLLLLAVVLVGKVLITKGVLEVKNPWIPRINGACRWIVPHPRMRLQPSEFAKLGFIMMFAWYLRDRFDHRTIKGLLKCFVLAAMPMSLILFEPDLGTVLLFVPIFFAMLFAAGCRIRHVIVIFLLVLLAMPLAYKFGLKPYQRDRVMMFFKQNSTDKNWLRDEGYQLHHSKSAIATGGLWGQGKDGFYVKNNTLPHRHNDFIWAMIAHQWGIVGCCVVLGIYGVLVVAGLEIASVQVDPFGKLIAVGVTTMLATQMILNIAIAMGLVPPTGMTLPFVSYGGSSMLSSFMAIGLLVNVARHQEHELMAKEAFVFED